MPTSGLEPATPARHRAELPAGTVSWLERPGSDPPVLLLHGWGANAASFTPLFRLSRTRRRLLALDLPGFGESPKGGTSWTTAAYAALVAQLVLEQGWGRLSLLGHSYGGSVCLRLAGEQLVPADRLLLVAAAGIRPPSGRSGQGRITPYRVLRRSAELLPRAAAEPALEWLRQHFGSADYRAAGEMRGTLVAAVLEDLSPVARLISVPTLIIWGRLDPELPLQPHGERLGGLITSSELVVLDQSGHFPFLDEGPRFAAIFDSFVDAEL